MRKIVLAFLLVSAAACGTKKSSSPTETVNAFVEDARKGDFEGMKKHLSSQDLALIQLGEGFMAKFDSAEAGRVKRGLTGEFSTRVQNATVSIKEQQIMGDTARVLVEFSADGSKSTQPLLLKKENGEWKISLLATGMKASGISPEQMQEGMKELQEGMRRFEGMPDSIRKGMQKLKELNIDSLQQAVRDSLARAT